MRRSSLLLILIVLCSFDSSKGQGSGIGLVGGLNLAAVSITTDINGTQTLDRDVKFALGLSYTKGLKEKFSIRGEALFNQLGYEPEPSTNIEDISYNYATLAILGAYHPNEDVTLLAGLEPSFLLGGNDLENGDNSSDGITAFDLSMAIGLHISFGEVFGVGLRFLPGLTNVAEDDQGIGLKMRHQNIRIYSTLLF